MGRPMGAQHLHVALINAGHDNNTVELIPDMLMRITINPLAINNLDLLTRWNRVEQ